MSTFLFSVVVLFWVVFVVGAHKLRRNGINKARKQVEAQTRAVEEIVQMTATRERGAFKPQHWASLAEAQKLVSSGLYPNLLEAQAALLQGVDIVDHTQEDKEESC